MGNKAISTLNPQALGELTENTNFNEKEIRKWYKDFLKDFPDGNITLDQFKELYTQHFPNGDATKFAEHVFRTFDKDENHKLDFREFLCALSVTARGGPQERLQWAFEMYDIDESGCISREECVEIIKAIYSMRGGNIPAATPEMSVEDRVNQIFTKWDKNKDNTLDLKEFMEGVKSDDFLFHVLQNDQKRF